MESINELWEGVLQRLREHDGISETGFQSWIACIDPCYMEGTRVVVKVHTDFQRNIITAHYFDKITTALEQVAGFPLSLQITTDEEQPRENAFPVPTASPEELARQAGVKSFDSFYTFDNFVVGNTNNFAYSAAHAVANNPAQFYNPLFIHGGSGLGKTHLLFAIRNRIKQSDPSAYILYTKGETLMNDLVAAIANKTTAQFRAKYREADVLLVDDIQFIGGKQAVQEEFFHIFETLHQSNRQIVLTSDRPPKDIATLEDRLRGRFEMGLLADIQAPDLELRIAIVKIKAMEKGVPMSDDVAHFIAEQLKNNVRQLDGAVTKLKANLMMGETLSLATAKMAIRDIRADNQAAPITVARILNEIEQITGVSAKDICGKSHAANFSQARKAVICIARQLTGLSMTKIGEELGGRDHTTIVYSANQADKLYKSDVSFRGLVDDVIKNLKSEQ
ncbi:MAG: chromosomal replication initiator protein DnaA [Ruminococcaceae bacterium]|nr:chromosomal replication initiator protein DnaA [Oscillospiraceae bacterium]